MDLLEQCIQNQVPSFLHHEILFCDKFLHKRRQHCIVLARNLKFYKFYRKQLLNCIDLSETCLTKLSQNIYDYKGTKGKCFKILNPQSGEGMGNATNHGGSQTYELQSTNFTEDATNVDVNISFGKYIYRNFDICKIYFLVHCWDKLVVINFTDYSFVTEYEGVKHFRIVHGKVKFIAILELQFENGSTTCTDFQLNENLTNHQETNDGITNTKSNFKHMLERVRCARAELQLHKSTTQRDFDILHDLETHGCYYVRSEQLEEKPMISRCGDIWTRLVASNTLVLGVPLINNCSANSLTLLKNLKPIFKTNDITVANIFYKYRLYQLSTKFDDLETMETYFQTEDDELNTIEQQWVNSKYTQLLPACFGVLLIAIKMPQIFLLEECPLFLYFEIEKLHSQLPGHISAKTKIYEQHLFLKTIKAANLFMNREKYVLSFDNLTCNQDFLACAMLNKETTLYIEFHTSSSAMLFEQFICKTFNFITFERNLNVHDYEINHKLYPPPNLWDEKSIKPIKTHVATGICYNNDPKSLWFGSMVVKTAPCTNEKEGIHVWKLYLHDKENAFVCLKALFDELSNCAIKTMKYFVKSQEIANSHFLNINNSLTAEIEYLMNFNKCVDPTQKKKILMDLMKIQIETDVLMHIHM